MRPPSYDEFINEEQDDNAFSPENPEPFVLEVCPVPGCKCKALHTVFEEGVVKGFWCEDGCNLTAKHNAFTNDLICYSLDKFDESRFEDPRSMHGMKFNPMGEIFTDWY